METMYELTTNMLYCFEVQRLKSLLKFCAGGKESRVQLRHLLFEPFEDGVTVVACDGHVLAYHTFTHVHSDEHIADTFGLVPLTEPVMIHKDDIDMAIKSKGRQVDTLFVGITSDGTPAIGIYGKTDKPVIITSTPQEDLPSYPDWRSCLPEIDGSQRVISFNGEMLSTVGAVGEGIRKSITLRIPENPHTAALFENDEGTQGLIMPLKQPGGIVMPKPAVDRIDALRLMLKFRALAERCQDQDAQTLLDELNAKYEVVHEEVEVEVEKGEVAG